MRPASQFAARLSRDEAGNILPIAAIGLLIGALIIGSAVDLGRTYLAEEQLQAACDAGVLAGRRAVTTNGFDATSKAAAKAFFNTNYNDNAQTTRSTTFDPVSSDDGNTVTATATTVLDTLLMRVFMKDSFNISVTCGSSMGVGNADVMMVLDTTGSMGNSLGGSTRIAALRTAMKNFYTTMSNATSGSNARIRYGFVPFSSSVNVGRLLNDLDTRYIVDARTYQSRWYEPDSDRDNDTTGSWVKASSTSYDNSSCGNKVPTDNSVTETGSGSSRQQRRVEYACRKDGKYYIYYRYVYRPYVMRYRPVTYDTSVFKTFASVGTPTGSYGANQNSTWGGCIEERSTVAQSTFSYSSATGITPKTALDLDLDSAPNVTNDSTKWAPMLPQITYRRWNSNGNYSTTAPLYDGELGGTYCPVQARLLGEMTQSKFNEYADSLVAVGGTYLDIGMIWGGRLASPQGMWQGLVN
ncbi:MAG TPA: pilus assembly protein TadG-related protein, partial [Novosphingobium sp.]|nr:pilus assembly protein TadG-related protein [Novosphingobium sp.]